ncbi:MAG: T9SS type A sorting domain-containing protein, partial [Flavobacteriales bacterium]|nr:T9SS type A sorting domain-containing protein [Flavobacteriales bacterium]
PISIDFFNKISENIDRPSLIVYPNPASSQITVNTPLPANITIVDVFGRIVLQTFLIEGANIVNIQNIANGSYLIYHDSGIAAKLEICK